MTEQEDRGGGPDHGRVVSYIVAQFQERFPDDHWQAHRVVGAKTKTSFMKAGKKGQGDILGCRRGRYVELEVKTGSGRQKPAQRDHQKKIERAGGVYAVVHSLDDALRVVHLIDEQLDS